MRPLLKVFFLLLILGSESRAGDLIYIDTSIENASPLYYQVQDDGVVQVYLVYDHERNSTNRAAGHWHFRVEATPNSTVTFVLNNFYNVWNRTPGFPISDKTITFYSNDDRTWTALDTDLLEGKDRLQFTIPIGPSGEAFVARLPPYRLSDLECFLKEISSNPNVDVSNIGYTVQQRPLEIIRVGNPEAPHKIFLRARAHPWEPGGNWIIEGMVRHLLSDGGTKNLDKYCVYIHPMANKDGVANGRTRFNMLGRDLNRNWDVPADPKLCPENHALEQWLQSRLAAGDRFTLALELHNDERGLLHISRPDTPDLDAYLARIDRLERMLREKTWFREGSTKEDFRNPSTLGEGWFARFGIHALVHELNSNWIEGLQQYPSEENWMLYGRQLCDVFYDYCD